MVVMAFAIGTYFLISLAWLCRRKIIACLCMSESACSLKADDRTFFEPAINPSVKFLQPFSFFSNCLQTEQLRQTTKPLASVSNCSHVEVPSSLSHSVFHFLAVVNVIILCLGADDGALPLALAVTNTGSCCDNTGTGMGVVWQTGDRGVVCFFDVPDCSPNGLGERYLSKLLLFALFGFE